MAADPDPYSVLAVPRSATQEQIRRAYKRACLRNHPDKHPAGEARSAAEARFKDISKAYSQLYDRRSAPTPRTASQHTPPSPPSPFSFDPFFEFFTARGGTPEDAIPDRELHLPLSLEELFTGCVKRRKLRNEASAPVMTIAVKPGYRPGDRIRFRTAAGSTKGDVVFVLAEKPHDRFVVDGDDLKMTMRVHLVDALAGAVLMVKGVDGKEVKVRINSVIAPGDVHTINDQGMPRRETPTERGDLHIAFEIIFPKRVEADDRSAVRELFARLDAHARNRSSMRRSSSLFMNRQTAASMLSQRRASTTTAFGNGVSEDGACDTMGDRRGRGRLRFTSIFR